MNRKRGRTNNKDEMFGGRGYDSYEPSTTSRNTDTGSKGRAKKKSFGSEFGGDDTGYSDNKITLNNTGSKNRSNKRAARVSALDKRAKKSDDAYNEIMNQRKAVSALKKEIRGNNGQKINTEYEAMYKNNK